MYDFYKWKLSFDSYKESIPFYYNDYFNSFFKFLQIPQTSQMSIYSVSSERRLFEQNNILAQLVKDLR